MEGADGHLDGQRSSEGARGAAGARGERRAERPRLVLLTSEPPSGDHTGQWPEATRRSGDRSDCDAPTTHQGRGVSGRGRAGGDTGPQARAHTHTHTHTQGPPTT